ncbi:MAG: hypothetical protein HXX16_17150 [Bacteroidales bacterium]|nr:hypothetical protein [Bacteroidales bacterium]
MSEGTAMTYISILVAGLSIITAITIGYNFFPVRRNLRRLKGEIKNIKKVTDKEKERFDIIENKGLGHANFLLAMIVLNSNEKDHKKKNKNAIDLLNLAKSQYTLAKYGEMIKRCDEEIEKIKDNKKDTK